MFYSDNDFDDLLSCPKCRKSMYDPRILPCGNTICNSCIVSNDKNFNCFICNQDHLTPENGFIKNQTVLKLLNKRPHEIYRGRKAEELKLLLKKLKEISGDLEDCTHNSENSIQKYLDSLRLEIDLTAEIAIKKIQDCRDELHKEINTYQKDKNNFNQLEEKDKNKYAKTIERIGDFHDKWQAYLNKTDINESDIDSAILDAKRQINIIQRDYQECKSHIYNHKIAQFESKKLESNDVNILGLLKYSYLPGFIDINTMREFDLSFYHSDSNEIIGQDIFSDGRILIIWKVKSLSDFVFSIFDQDFHPILSNIVKNIEIPFVEDYAYKIIGSHIIFMSYQYCSDEKTKCYKINLNDFKITKEIDIEKIYSISFNSESMFIITDESSTTGTDDLRLHIYDNDLNLVKSVGQSVSKDQEYFIPSEDVFAIFANDQYLFLTYENPLDIILLNQENGQFVRKISTEEKYSFNSFFITSDSLIATFKKSKLCFFSPYNGKIIYEKMPEGIHYDYFKEKDNLFLIRDLVRKKLYIN